MNKSAIALFVLFMILSFFSGVVFSSLFLSKPIEKESPFETLDLQANKYREILRSNGIKIINGTKPDSSLLYVEIHTFSLFLQYHSYAQQNSPVDVPVVYYDEPMLGGHIPTFYFLLVESSYTWIMVFRVYNVEK